MSVSDVTPVVAATVAVVAVVVALFAMRAARRSAAASERSAAAATRQLELAEAAAASAAARPPWQMSRTSAGASLEQWECVNDSSSTVFDVTVAGGLVFRGPVRADEVDSRSGVGFTVLRSSSGNDDPVVVTWRAKPGGELRTWRRPLP